jgi:hypothetical protein
MIMIAMVTNRLDETNLNPSPWPPHGVSESENRPVTLIYIPSQASQVGPGRGRLGFGALITGRPPVTVRRRRAGHSGSGCAGPAGPVTRRLMLRLTRAGTRTGPVARHGPVTFTSLVSGSPAESGAGRLRLEAR